jgi:hypothetical protein
MLLYINREGQQDVKKMRVQRDRATEKANILKNSLDDLNSKKVDLEKQLTSSAQTTLSLRMSVKI